MPEVRLNKEQLDAAGLLDRNVVLSAGAGCGKTSTLVERFITILDSGLAQVSDIAAITFTEKAANELKERIHSRLETLRSTSPAGPRRGRWQEVLAQVEMAQISTIHGFCSEILREYSVEAGLDPAFSVIENIEAGVLAARAVQDALFAAVESGEPAAERLLERYEFPVLESMVADSLGKRDDIALLTASLDLSNPAKAADALKSETIELARQAAVESLWDRDFEKAISSLSNVAGPDDDKLELARGAFVAAHNSWKLSRSADLRGALSAMMAALEDARGGSSKKWGDGFARVKADLKACKEVVQKALGALEGVDSEDWPARAAEMRDFVALHQKALDEYTSAKRKSGLVDFDDLLIYARDLVKKSAAVAAAVAERYPFILIDEFQDTDRVQYELISALAEKGSRLFVVGDPEQSIYAFRGAKVEILNGIVRSYEETGLGAVRTLSQNQRTLPGLLAFVNLLFSRLMPPGGGAQWMISHAPLSPARAGAGKSIELLVAAPAGNMPYARRVEADGLAKRIKEIVGSEVPLVHKRGEGGEDECVPAAYGDFAILFRSMTSVDIYERALRDLDIPYYTVAGSTFYIRREVKDIVSFLRFVVDGDDSLSLVAALRSPLFGVCDDLLAALALARPLPDYFCGAEPEARRSADLDAFRRAVSLVGRLRMLSNRVPARQVVDEILDVTGFLVTLSVLYGGRQRVANVLKLRDAAAAFDARGGGRLGDFVRHISEFEMTEARESEALTEDERAPVVRLMSIHNAKGLEFPIVVVADMGRKKNTQGTGRAVARIDHRIGISLPESSEDKTPYYTVVRRVEASRSEAEEMRVFYVAATRARDHLILSGAAGGRGGGAAAAAQGWAGAALAALSLDLSSPGSIDLDGMTLEYSCPKEPLGPGRRGVKPPILHWRDRLLAGKFLPKASHPLQRQVLARCAKIGGSAKSGDRFVATELADFSRCPLQYELRHLRGLPPDYRLADPVGKDAAPPAHLVGTLLHAVLERARRFDSLSSVLEKLLATDMSYTGWAAGLRRECLPILKRFEASPFFQRMRAADCEREKGFSFLLEGFLIEGTMDLFMKGQVVDFKSDDVTAQEAPAHAQEYRSQMDVYALAYERLTGAPPDRVVLYFLRPELEVSWDYGPKETAAAQKRVLGTIRTILAGPPFAAARENAKCHCEYQSLCAFIRDRRSAHTAEA